MQEIELINLGLRSWKLVPSTSPLPLTHAPTHHQVAVERTRPHGRVIGIDLIPAQPPRGVSTFQGDFLSPTVQSMVKTFITDSHKQKAPAASEEELSEEGVAVDEPSYFEMASEAVKEEEGGRKGADATKGRLVDVSEIRAKDGGCANGEQVVLSDMSAPWEQTTGYNVNTLSNPYIRLMNTSGNAFRDHAGSMVRLFSLHSQTLLEIC